MPDLKSRAQLPHLPYPKMNVTRTINAHRAAAGGGEGNLLDSYTNAIVAFSFRLLRSDYSGDCLRIREDGGDTETDIGFSSGELDVSAIASHCGANNGYVVTWYDQSGSANNASQSTPSYQPQIYNGSSVITENGKPAMQVTGSNSYLDISNTALTDADIFSVFYGDDSTAAASVFGGDPGDAYMPVGQNGKSTTSIYIGIIPSDVYVNSVVQSWSNRNDAFDGINQNSQILFTVEGATTSAANDFNRIWAADTPSYYNLKGRGQEFVGWEGSEGHSRADIESELNSYYSIY